MKRSLFAALALIMAIGMQTQSASAQASNSNSNSFWAFLNSNQDPRLWTPGVGVGIASAITSWLITEKHGNPGVRHVSYGTAYGVTTFGCMVVYPMVATVWVNRMLTPREAYIGFANCAVPIIGGWLVDRYLPHTAWYDGTPEKHHHK